MTDFERIRAVKKAAQGRLLSIPGVHAVGIGMKIVDGKRTSEPCITVVLVKKKPLSQIPESQLIPKEIEGIKTDVIESEVPRLHNGRDNAKERPLQGGVMLQVKGGNEFGTLGCIVQTLEPQPKIAALTCQHVVDIPLGKTGDLHVISSAADADPFLISFNGSNTPRSLVVVKIYDSGANVAYNVFWLTTESDTLTSIASSVKSAIQNLNLAVTITSPLPEQIKIDASAGDIQVKDCTVYDPRVSDGDTKLQVSITGTNIALAGKTSGDYALYVTLNANGPDPTHGAFIPVKEDSALTTVANDVATAINNLSVTGLHATASGTQVNITGVNQIECDVKEDQRVGQPTDSFCSICSRCCSDKIGHVIAAKLDLDAALIQLDSGLEYLAQIKEIGAVSGTHHVTDPEANGVTPYKVQKRGVVSGWTHGTIYIFATAGYTTNDDGQAPPNWIVFYRFYDEAIWVKGDPDPFSERGDSGSAVLNDAREVIGILFAGSSGKSLVTPIGSIETAFNISIATAASTGTVHTVSEAAHAASMSTGTPGETRHTMEISADWERMKTFEHDIRSTAAGERYAQLIQQHFQEAQNLVNTNRRVATAWHRHGGPEIVRSLLQETHLPAEVNGKPLPDCLAGIEQAFRRYGSPQLAADIDEYAPPLAQLAGLSYPQTLDALREMRVE